MPILKPALGRLMRGTDILLPPTIRPGRRAGATTREPVPCLVMVHPRSSNGYNCYMTGLATMSDAELAQRLKCLRGEQLRRLGRTQTCMLCGNEFHARSGARYCSGTCRVAAFRARVRADASPSREVKR